MKTACYGGENRKAIYIEPDIANIIDLSFKIKAA